MFSCAPKPGAKGAENKGAKPFTGAAETYPLADSGGSLTEGGSLAGILVNQLPTDTEFFTPGYLV